MVKLTARKCDSFDAGMLDFESLKMAISEAARPRSPSDWLAIEEAAALLGVSVRTLQRWQAAGVLLERSKRGRRQMYRGAHLRVLAIGLKGLAAR